MVRLAAIVLFAAVGASSAAAQTTTCGWELGRWVCRTPTSLMDAFNQSQRQAFEQTQRVIEARRARLAAEEQASVSAQEDFAAQARANNEAAYRSMLAGLVRDGKCDEAKKYALDKGDMNGAEQAVRLCTPR